MLEKKLKDKEAKARQLTLEMIGDLPYADIKPPEHVLFVCKLNPVTRDEDLELIFSRFGKVNSCEVIRDKLTGDSLCYAFVEFDEKAACEEAYFKMQNVLIDDRRIHVDFSQSVSKLHKSWLQDRTAGRGLGGFEGMEKRSKYRAGTGGVEAAANYDFVFESEEHGAEKAVAVEKPRDGDGGRRRADDEPRRRDDDRHDDRRRPSDDRYRSRPSDERDRDRRRDDRRRDEPHRRRSRSPHHRRR